MDKPAIFDKPELLYDIKMGNQHLFIDATREVKKGNATYIQSYMFAFSIN